MKKVYCIFRNIFDNACTFLKIAMLIVIYYYYCYSGISMQSYRCYACKQKFSEQNFFHIEIQLHWPGRMVCDPYFLHYCKAKIPIPGILRFTYIFYLFETYTLLRIFFHNSNGKYH